MELHIHFVGVVKLGEFVEARAEVVRATRSVVFLETKMFVGDRLVAAANGIWKIIGAP
jgi:acyl-coenzyme A thioesterase PaaI-like protein